MMKSSSLLSRVALSVWLLFLNGGLFGQDAGSNRGKDPLVTGQADVAEQLARLEELLLRSADLEAADNPTRAALLQQAVQLSKQAQLLDLLKQAASNLEANKYSEAIERQKAGRENLKRLLELLQSENREKRVREQRDQVRRWIEETDRLLRLQSSLRGRTEGGQDTQQAASDQNKLSSKAQEIAGQLGDDSDAQQKQENGSPEESKQSDGKQSDGKQSDGKQSDGQQSDGKQSDGKQSDGKQSDGKQSDGKQPSEPQTPTERAKQRIDNAKRKMQEAQEALENAEREGAVEKQRQAEEELREAIEELEEILRQLREEEIERSLDSLETRLRRMLEAQAKIVDETQRLQEIGGDQPNRQVEVKANTLAREEQKVLADGERALLLLKEEGSSAAFPEAIIQVNRDIANVIERLQGGDVGRLTLVIENEIVQSLEEMLEAIAAVQKKNEEKKRQQQQGGGQQGQQGDQPLVDQLAELRLIRTLQVRINKRTETLSQMLDDPNDPVGQVEAGELQQELQSLGERESRIEDVTREISKNRG